MGGHDVSAVTWIADGALTTEDSGLAVVDDDLGTHDDRRGWRWTVGGVGGGTGGK